MKETMEVVQIIFYSFSEFLWEDKQYATIFRKIRATLFFYPCTI